MVERVITRFSYAIAVMFVVGATIPTDVYADSPAESCREQASQSERNGTIPDGLILAIGKRESGRRDSTSGATLPWPWAVNVDGAGRSFNSLPEAVAFVLQASSNGARSIDVGCMQVSLLYHPDAFATLEDAFDPALNTAYAAQYLSHLHATLGSWEAAVAAYHSADPARGGPYRDQVYAAWQGRTGPATAAPRVPAPIWGIHVWGPGDASVIEVSAHARRMPIVISPHSAPSGHGS